MTNREARQTQRCHVANARDVAGSIVGASPPTRAGKPGFNPWVGKIS